MKIVALMTAKGNSSCCPKNLLPVAGKPLVWYPAYVASKCRDITDFYVSSDSNEILDICSSLGYKKIKRPDELAKPDSLHIDAINHALSNMKQTDGVIPDILIVLLGNAVSIKLSWLEKSIALLRENPDITAVTPVYKEQDHHPYRARRLNQQGCVVPYFDFSKQQISSNRQDLPDNFFFCHNYWALRLVNGHLQMDGFPPWNFMGKNVAPIIVDRTIDVHAKAEIVECEKWLQKNDILS